MFSVEANRVLLSQSLRDLGYERTTALEGVHLFDSSRTSGTR